MNVYKDINVLSGHLRFKTGYKIYRYDRINGGSSVLAEFQDVRNSVRSVIKFIRQLHVIYLSLHGISLEI